MICWRWSDLFCDNLLKKLQKLLEFYLSSFNDQEKYLLGQHRIALFIELIFICIFISYVSCALIILLDCDYGVTLIFCHSSIF